MSVYRPNCKEPVQCCGLVFFHKVVHIILLYCNSSYNKNINGIKKKFTMENKNCKPVYGHRFINTGVV